MEIIIPILGLLVALAVLVRGADVFVDGATALGGALGMSSFAIGVLIVGFGTSLPEFASSFAAVLQGSTDIAIANVVGSNITNVLLIVGLTTIIGGAIYIKQDLLKTELPVFFIATTHVVFSLRDGVIDRLESVLLLGTFAAYVWYLFVESRNGTSEGQDQRPPIRMQSIGFIIGGLAALILGAKISVDMIERLGEALSIPVGLISITVLAIGTSLPELFVSVRAALRKEVDLAIGNIFGSNAFNALFVIGIPGLLMPLTADTITMELGLPVMIAASLILVIAGLSTRIMRWEGIMMLMFFAFFIAKLTVYL
jgi:cation:H+ antiporter